MLFSLSVSRLTLTRYFLSSIPKFTPFLLSFSSQSQFINNNVDNVVSSFHRMLQMSHTPSIVEFNKILTSLVKTKHYTTVISLYHQMEFKGITPDLITLNILSDSWCSELQYHN
jgi:pentatricopeptide repeat protein